MKGQSLLTNVVMATLMQLPLTEQRQALDVLWPELPPEEQEELRVAMCEARVDQARIPRRFSNCTFDNFTVYNASLERALGSARRLTEEFPATARGLVLSGPAGVGKTHLAAATLTSIVRATGIVGIFTSIREIEFGRRDESRTAHDLVDAGVVVIDDLGSYPHTDLTNTVVDARYDAKRLTIFTTYFPDIPDPTNPTSLLYRIGFRTHSRLYETCEFHDLDGADYRELPVGGNVDDLVTLWKVRRRQPRPGAANASAAHKNRSQTSEGLEALLRTTTAERDEARAQLQTIGKKAFWAAKAPSDQKP